MHASGFLVVYTKVFCRTVKTKGNERFPDFRRNVTYCSVGIKRDEATAVTCSPIGQDDKRGTQRCW